MGDLLACMCVHCIHILCLQRPEEGVGSCGIEVTIVNTMWVLGLKPGLLEEQPVLLTTEPSLRIQSRQSLSRDYSLKYFTYANSLNSQNSPIRSKLLSTPPHHVKERETKSWDSFTPAWCCIARKDLNQCPGSIPLCSKA